MSPSTLSSDDDPTFTPEKVSEAYSLIQNSLHKTPILTSSQINALTTPPLSIYFKAEVFQKTGAFKFRGASHAIARLPPSSLEKGVITHSSGNHSAALARAARERNVKCRVVMVFHVVKETHVSLPMPVN
jgi:threonine dehydratase